MFESNAALTRPTAPAASGAGLAAYSLTSESGGVASALGAPAREVAPRGFFFANPTFHFETLRNAGYIVSNCADLGEMFETVKGIVEGDPQSWYTAWEATAARALALAEHARDPVSKGDSYMRASTYQRMAEFLLAPDDPKRPASLEKISTSFFKGLNSLGVHYESLSVPYGDGRLRALYFPGPQRAETRPLIMFGGGFDSILEEYYPNITVAALKRGYSVLIYEGPGQGEALRKYGLTYTFEWEKPVGAVLDEFLKAHAKPANIVLIGMSMGGYFAPRAAAFDERIDGVVAYDTCYDFGEVANRVISAAKAPEALKNIGVSWAYNNARWTMGTQGIEDTLEACAAYTLAPIADRIRQDVLILQGTEDHFIPLHQTTDFERALINARSVTTRIFDRESGGADHCQPGALTRYHATLFDWLLERFPAKSTG